MSYLFSSFRVVFGVGREIVRRCCGGFCVVDRGLDFANCMVILNNLHFYMRMRNWLEIMIDVFSLIQENWTNQFL